MAAFGRKSRHSHTTPHDTQRENDYPRPLRAETNRAGFGHEPAPALYTPPGLAGWPTKLN
ncbi:MAG: hypothetical protein LBU69_05235 [Deltaproteobacteria bacterium]|nr:hypothetical protein [Deltaproteobacteria bacterium]